MRAVFTPGRISVVMPCFNAEPFVGEAVDSVLRQAQVDLELIVVDDGSTDGSLSILEGYGARIALLRQVRRGPYPARNAGLAQASGEFIAFLDADDWWQAETLVKLQTALVGSGADIAYCGWQNVGFGVTGAPYVPPAYEAGDSVEAFLRTCPWPIHAALVRREVVVKLGGFSERRFSSMDYDFWLRCLGLTRKLVRVPEVLAYYRWHGADQISAVKWRQVLDALAVQKDFISANPDLVAHLSVRRLRELTERRVVEQALRALWKRDVGSAHKLFRHAALSGAFAPREIPHVASSLLPLPVFRWLVGLADSRRR
ncbi:MAG: glycosyltransferase [Burkholderiaceae bacterium]|jgi:glycosyltransferase involved in cell wall biosynthesis|nr:glycosyltransferase [Burkholderiaceae bacterium]